MFDLKFFKNIFGGESNFPNSRSAGFEELPPDGLTMGTLYIGRPGSGKTSSLARHIVNYFKTYPDRALFVLDWSGSITDAILSFIQDDESLLKRVVYDEMGHPEWVIPLPEFSNLYGDYEEQVQRVANNLTKLAPELIRDAPFLAGLGIREIAPEVFRLLTSVTNDYGETWQITEAKKLITDEALLTKCSAKYGDKVPQAKWFFEKNFLPLRRNERELRTYAILALLGAIETPEIRARIGYYKPAWTPKEAIKNGRLVIVNGARLINQPNTQHYLFTQVYSLIMAEINKRIPGDPHDQPVSIVMDEVYSLLSIPGMAEEIGKLSPLYRSRKLELYIVLQSLSQLAITLRQQIWSIGNIVCFAITNFQEAYELSQQLFVYDPNTIKLGAKSDTQQPVTESDRGQYLKLANQIQRMKHRECLVRRYMSEKVLDKYLSWVPKTKDVPGGAASVQDIKERLLKERGVKVREALEVINQRKFSSESHPQVPAL